MSNLSTFTLRRPISEFSINPEPPDNHSHLGSVASSDTSLEEICIGGREMSDHMAGCTRSIILLDNGPYHIDISLPLILYQVQFSDLFFLFFFCNK